MKNQKVTPQVHSEDQQFWNHYRSQCWSKSQTILILVIAGLLIVFGDALFNAI